MSLTFLVAGISGVQADEEAFSTTTEPVVSDLGPAAVGTAVNGAEMVGDTVYMVSRQLVPPKLSALDLQRGEVSRSVAIPTGIEGWAATAVNDGQDLYFGMHTPADLYHYDTVAGQLTPEPVATFPRDLLVMDQAAAGDDTVFLATMARPAGSTYRGVTATGDGSIYSYDPDTGETRDYGSPAPGQRYARSVAATDDTIYAGMGTAASLEAIDRDTGEHTTVDIPELESESFVYDIAVSDTHLVFGTEPSGLLGIVDLADHSYEVVPVPDGRTVDAVAISGDKAYFTARFAGSLYEYDIPTGELTYLATPSQGEEHRKVFVRDGSIVGVGGTGTVWTYDLQSGTTEILDALESGMPTGPERLVQSLAVVEGTPYVGGHWGVQRHDPTAGTSTRFRIPGEPKSMTGIDGKLYAALYPSSQVWTYDPDDHQVRSLARIQEEQMRPRIVHHDPTTDTLLVGTRPVYGQLGGALSVVEPESGAVQTFRNVVQDQSPTALTSIDGVAYVGTEIQGELATPTTTEGKLAAWGIRTRRKGWEVVPVPGAHTVTSLATVADAERPVIYGTANNGTLFVVEPATGDVLFTAKPGTSALQLTVLDGVVYGLSNKGVFRVEETNGSYAVSPVVSGSYQYLAADDSSDTRLYATGVRRIDGVNESRLFAIDVPPTDGSLTWRVVDEDGAALGGSSFELTGPDGSTMTVRDNEAPDADPSHGSFLIDDARFGDYSLAQIGAAPAHSCEEALREVSISVQQPAGDFGTVTNAGTAHRPDHSQATGPSAHSYDSRRPCTPVGSGG